MKRQVQKILITGMPYSGKTYLSEFFKKAGINAVDADSIKKLGKWFDKHGKETKFDKNADDMWLKNHDFLWDKNFLRLWLKKQKLTAYLFGISANIFDMAYLFDKSYYLRMTPKILKKRLAENERLNPMGHTRAQQELILKNIEDFNKKAEKYGLIPVDADLKPEKIYSVITNTN